MHVTASVNAMQRSSLPHKDGVQKMILSELSTTLK
jgi:hypothetical protein